MVSLPLIIIFYALGYMTSGLGLDYLDLFTPLIMKGHIPVMIHDYSTILWGNYGLGNDIVVLCKYPSGK